MKGIHLTLSSNTLKMYLINKFEISSSVYILQGLKHAQSVIMANVHGGMAQHFRNRELSFTAFGFCQRKKAQN